MTGPASGRPLFPAALRLRRAAEFSRVFRRSSRSHDRFFTVLACPNELSSGRLGLAISKKSCKSAVGRNRLKRLIRESFRHARTRLPSVDLVVMARAEAAGADAATLRTSLEKHWTRIIRTCAG